MQVRIGVCTNCDAKFEVPVSFDQPWAKCLICESAVRIGEPEKSDAAKKAERKAAAAAKAPAAPKAKPKVSKAKKSAGAAAAAAVAAAPAEAELEAEPLEEIPPPAPEPEVEEVEEAAIEEAAIEEAALEEAELELEPLEEDPPAAKPMSTLERLKAERAAQAAAEAPAEKPVSTLDRIKAERAASEAGERPAPRKGSGGKAKPSAARARGGDDGGDGGKRSRGGRRRPAAAKAEKSQTPLLVGAGSLVLVGVGVIGITQGWFSGAGDEPEVVDDGATEVADAPAEDTINPFDAVAGANTAAAGLGAGTAPGGASAASALGSGTPAEASAPTPAPEPANKPGRDPDSVDLDSLPDYDKLPETSAEDWSGIVEDARKLVDPNGGIGAQRAQRRLVEHGKDAFPAIMNVFKTVDLHTEDGLRIGALVQRTLEDICNGVNYGWQDGLDREQIWFNKRVVVAWNEAWGKAKDNDITWASLSGQDRPAEEESGEDDGEEG